MARTDTTINQHSYSWMIRNVILDRLKLVTPFSGPDGVVKFSRSPAVMGSIQEEHIPYLGCYIMPDETFTGIGRNNIGENKFTHALLLGFSYIVFNNDPDAAEELLDIGHWSIMKLMHDPDFFIWPSRTFPDGVERLPMFSSVLGGARRPVYGTAGRQQMTPIAEMQMELTIMYETHFEPVIADAFEGMHFKVVYPWPEDPNRQPIVAEWLIPQTATAQAPRKTEPEPVE